MLSKEGFIALSLKFFGGCSSFEKRKKKRVIDPCSRVILVKNLDGGNKYFYTNFLTTTGEEEALLANTSMLQ